MCQAILNKSWRQHPTKHQLYSHLPPITKTLQVRRTRHAGHCWRSRDELISGPPHMAEQKQDDQLEHTYRSCVRIRDVAQKTCQRRWTIEKRGERGSGISVLAARHGDVEYTLFPANPSGVINRTLYWSTTLNLINSNIYHLSWLRFTD